MAVGWPHLDLCSSLDLVDDNLTTGISRTKGYS